MSNLLISMTFLDITSALTAAGTFWLYAGFAALGLVFIYFVVPETKGLTLEQITAKLDPSGSSASTLPLQHDDDDHSPATEQSETVQ